MSNYKTNKVQCELQEESIKVLIKCEWKQLKTLNISLNKMTDNCMNLLHCANWPLLN